MSLSEREEEYGKIRKDHLKAVEESKEKIQIAEESYGLVDRYQNESWFRTTPIWSYSGSSDRGS